MKPGFFRLPQLSPTRLPRLYYGKGAENRPLDRRAQFADQLFLSLQIISFFLFMITGMFGYSSYGIFGLLIFALVGYVIGVWIRRSLGMRDLKPTTGFFSRMRERAAGAPPGLLEWLLEKISRNEVTQADARELVLVYEKAVKRLKTAKTPQDQNQILADLDRKVKQIYYRA